MGHSLKLLLALLLGLSFTACEKVDIPGMFISYESVNQRFDQSMAWNAQHPFREIVVPADDYFILAMGDSHVGGTKNLDRLFEIAQSSDVSALVMAGDLTTGNADDYAVLSQHLPHQDSLASFLIPGNHELYFRGWDEFYSRFGSSMYVFTVRSPAATDLCICLDTGSGTLGNKQLDWLKEILNTLRPDYRRCIIFTHNNLFRFRRTTSTNPPVEELLVLMELFVKHDVDMVITGHDHKHFAQVFGNTTHIVMDALQDGLSYAGYLELHLSNGQIEYRFKNL
jgi:predicted phosphodiesterase